jgi:predicted glycoside hydrolase/deacetylase ChbG (UPF0249 family)
VHLFPRIAGAVIDVVAAELPDAWVRQCGRPHGAAGDRKAAVLDMLSRRFRARAAARGVQTNPAFAGTYDFRTRADYAALFPRFLERMPEGGVIMCHPGIVDDELVQLDPLTAPRAGEYAFFRGDVFPTLLASRNMTLA